MKIELNQIHQMDCLEGIKLLPSKSVDVIVTSPPYNIGLGYNTYQDTKSDKDYINWLQKVGKLCKRVLKDDGSFFLNIGGTLKNPWIPLHVACAFEKDYYLQNMIHWIKSIAIPKEQIQKYSLCDQNIAVGHYKPINSQRFHHDCHEFIFHFTKNGDVKLDKIAIGVPYQDKSNIRRWKSTNGIDKRDRGNTWFIPYETIQDSRPHPAIFPVKLPEMCILDHGLKNTKLVLDPFMGIGSTAIAAINLDVDFIGFEIDDKYINVANERINQALIAKKQIQLATSLLKANSKDIFLMSYE